MSQGIRLTAHALRVLRLFLEAPREERSGAQISRAVKIGSGTLYPLLARFESVGWLSSAWEAIDPTVEGRPRRRLYRLTAVGQAAAVKALQEVQIAPEALVWAR
jgi:DNA-binding PadR family transcriptional regulator